MMQPGEPVVGPKTETCVGSVTNQLLRHTTRCGKEEKESITAVVGRWLAGDEEEEKPHTQLVSA